MRVDKQAAAATSLIMSGLAVLVAMCCFGHAFANWRIGPVPLTIDRIALALLLLAYVALRWFGATAQAGARFADVVLAALVCWLWVRLFGTHWWTEPPIAGDAVPSFRLIAGYLIPAVMFWVAREAPVDARAMRMLHRGLALVGIYLGLTAIFEITGPRALVVPSYVTNPAIGIHFGRARGPMLQSVSLGIALAAGVFSMLSWICWSRRSVRLALGALLAIPLTGICLTYTRSVWIGAALGLVAVYAAMPRTARRTLISALLLTGFVLLLIARSPVTVSEPPAAESDRQAPAAAPADFLPDIKGLALGRSAEESRESAQMRLAFAYVSAKMFRDHPLAGVGFGGFPKAKLGYIDAEGARPELDAIRPYVHHSTLLSLLTECGIVGLVLFLLLVGSWAVAARNARRSHPPPNWIGNQATVMLGVLAMWFVQLLFHELSYATLDNALVFFLAGLTVSASLFQGRHTSAPLRASPGPDAANALGKPAAKVVAGSAAPARVAR